MRVAVFCVFLGISALVYSQRLRPCVAPTKWSGKFFQHDPFTSFSDYGEISYDAENQRVAYVTEVEYNGKVQDFIYDLYFFKDNEGTHYRWKKSTRYCTMEKLDRSFNPIHIPVNATFEREYYIGSSVDDDGVLVESWYGNGTDPGVFYRIVVAVDDCFPVSDIFFDEYRYELVFTEFINVVSGITDPDIFIPPKQCDEF